MSGMSPERVRRLFAQEAEVRLAELGRLLLRLEQNVDDETLVGSVFRELHTLKGSAAVAGLDEVSRMAHHLEEVVEEVRAGRRPITAEVIDMLLRGTDQLGAAVSGTQVDGPEVDSTHAEPATTNGLQKPRPSEARPPARPTTPPPVDRASVPAGARSDPPEGPAGGGGFIMVPVERLEELTRLVGETASAQLRVGRMLNDRFHVDPATCAEFNELSRSLNDLREHAMRAQMVPVSTITDQLHRAVRDLSRAQGKDVRWEAEGIDTEMDRGVLHRLSDSVMHLVRNAIDHGIESPAERERAGKQPRATLRLHAMQLGAEVIIAVSDDGRGIDTESVEREANRLGIDIEGLTQEERLGLSFRAGLSTAQFVTDVSGRGVGLDVVRTSVEAAQGRVEVRSEPGVGTEFRIIVPITVAVLRCLLVEAAGQRFALPFHRVLLSQAHEPSTVTHAEGRPVVWVDGHPVPVRPLGETLGLAGGGKPEGPVVVLAGASRRHAFGVDRLVGQRDVVIKALSPLLPRLPLVAGAGVEPDGSILVVLDPPGLIERAGQTGRTSGPKAPAVGPGAARRSVLVVDDALVVRELQRGILERAGFDVRVATDGQHALTKLAQERSDLVVTDIEMPTMDGFALTEAIRAHPSLANTPVLIVSSRASDSDRQRGMDAGADGYITKSAFDETSLVTAVNRLLGVTA
ncbi:response regulator [Antribacter sp. KLBMP9083]|uniref:histidine kinase n=1 Tax=Antribacter soli TaxID=2910976 RepID=A0AA41QGP3_9MICO|nr:response regulator [Antribacter soli]MCF4123145.1 response regulator [Antribacter soli]